MKASIDDKADRSTPMPSFRHRLLQPWISSPYRWPVVLTLSGLVAITVYMVQIVQLLVPYYSRHGTYKFPSAYSGLTVGIAVIVTFSLAAAARTYRTRRVEDLRAEVDRLIGNIVSDVLAQSESPAGSSSLEDQVASRVNQEAANKYERRHYWSQACDLTSAAEIHRRLQLRAADDEKTRSSAEEVILQLLPPLPRTAKRLLNKLYFLLVVAYNRDLITRRRVTPEQLGKWAVLLDRWPEAGKAIIKDPALVRVFEEAASQENKFVNLCHECTPPLVTDITSLRSFFLTDQKLGSAAYYLVYLDADIKIPRPPPGNGNSTEKITSVDHSKGPLAVPQQTPSEL